MSENKDLVRGIIKDLGEISNLKIGNVMHNGPERSLGLFKYIIGVTYIAGKLGHILVQNS